MYPEPNTETIGTDDFYKIVELLFYCFKAIDKKEPPPKEVVPQRYLCPSCKTSNSKTGKCTACETEISKKDRQPARLEFGITFWPENLPRAELARNSLRYIISSCLEGLGLQSSTISFTLYPSPQPITSKSEKEE